MTDENSRRKRRKTEEHFVPIVFADLNIRLGTKKIKTIRVLLDSGASATIVQYELVKKLRIKKDVKANWATMNGVFSTEGKAKIEFALPELNPMAVIQHPT